ncbi:hypothetical protein [Thermaurantiacus sp.]
MDLSGHSQFSSPLEGVESPADLPGARPVAAGAGLLLAAWSALQSANVESVDLHLRSGTVVRNAIRLRLSGPIAQASTRREGWTHLFPVHDVALVRFIGRGGRRD